MQKSPQPLPPYVDSCEGDVIRVVCGREALGVSLLKRFRADGKGEFTATTTGETDKAQLLTALRDAGFVFSEGREWNPVEIWEDLRSKMLVSGEVATISWSGPEVWHVRKPIDNFKATFDADVMERLRVKLTKEGLVEGEDYYIGKEGDTLPEYTECILEGPDGWRCFEYSEAGEDGEDVPHGSYMNASKAAQVAYMLLAGDETWLHGGGLITSLRRLWRTYTPPKDGDVFRTARTAIKNHYVRNIVNGLWERGYRDFDVVTEGESVTGDDITCLIVDLKNDTARIVYCERGVQTLIAQHDDLYFACDHFGWLIMKEGVV